MGAIQELLVDLGLGAGIAGTIESAALFVIAFIAIYVIGKRTVLPVTDRALERRDLDDHARKPLVKLASFGVVFVAVAVAFGFAGFGNFLSSLATIAAALALAIGLATQNIISNFVSGVFIYADKPFRIGDWIEWDGNSGVVEDISLRVTRVRTFDNEILTVPNSDLTANVVKNPVAKEKLRLKFVFGIGYDDDIEKATEIIVEEAEKLDGIMDDPAPSVRLTELNDSDVGLQSRVWIADPSRADFVKTRGEFITNVKARFDEEGIDIPYPQRELEGDFELTNRAALGADD
ncbi:mechanosensitive ion channel family protein [Natranaeroarchaeum sulfidigenes]|uniref:Small-conductance mechanosensitive channel n=1 Tax=Natranaeroarchaeum sulfidigenes TaxID=2784880 RepID=A0A897MRA3_9EURY|nr:mechanosensitive ion channel family protein [Natranaeroarchaeum sulfidigenes]QSG03057.1 Small-conductance mechanosensitive channel [Natranaeroarchaeum sulfidigenes]